jgi:hypothetical protein
MSFCLFNAVPVFMSRRWCLSHFPSSPAMLSFSFFAAWRSFLISLCPSMMSFTYTEIPSMRFAVSPDFQTLNLLAPDRLPEI